MRTPIRNPPDPMYAELEVHRTMICDRVRTEGFRRAIDAVVRPGDIVLDVGAGSGILSMFAARAGAARVYAVERTTVAVLAQELAAANGLGEIIEVIHGDVLDVELPEPVDVIVSEWLGGFGIDEGMLAPVIAARDRWLKPDGAMIPQSVTAWAGLVHDRHLDETVAFLRGNPYGLELDRLVDLTVNEILYSGTFRHLAEGDGAPSPACSGGLTRSGSRSRMRRRPIKPRRCCGSASTGRPTHSRSGSAPTSRPVSRSRSGPAIRRPTGG